MTYTLASIRSQLRFRLGEITPGTWSDAELNDCIYQAERKVCEDAITVGNAILVDTAVTNVIGGQYRYRLPSDTIAVLEVYHLKNNRYHRLRKGNIALMLDKFNPSSTSDTLTKWCVHGVAPDIITTGVATGGSNTTLVNTDVDFTTMGITANVDYVENITDDSRALITDVAANTITFSGGLQGGARNSFRLGDEYQIVTGEATKRLLYVYPVPSETQVETKTSHTTGADTSVIIGTSGGSDRQAAMSFQVSTDVVVRSVEIYLSGSTGSPVGPIVVRIETDNGGVPSGTLVSTNAVAVIESPSTGWNEVEFATPFRIGSGTTYHIVCKALTQSGDKYWSWAVDSDNGYSDGQVSVKVGSGAWSAQPAYDALFKVNGAEKTEDLIIYYARYPRKLVNDTDQSELPYWAKEAVLTYAMYLAFTKHPGAMTKEAQNARTLYEIEMQKVFQRMMDEENGHVDRVREVMWFGEDDTDEWYNISLPLGKA